MGKGGDPWEAAGAVLTPTAVHDGVPHGKRGLLQRTMGGSVRSGLHQVRTVLHRRKQESRKPVREDARTDVIKTLVSGERRLHVRRKRALVQEHVRDAAGWDPVQELGSGPVRAATPRAAGHQPECGSPRPHHCLRGEGEHYALHAEA